MRLWLSYQRYALLACAGILGLATSAVASGHAWWAWLVTGLASAVAVPLVVHIWRDYPRKWRATQLATRRIANGSFRVVAVKGYCGDPCWRIVAVEILRRAGLSRRERRRTLAMLRARHEAESHALIIIDHENGTLLRVEGNEAVRTTLPPRAT